MNSFYKLILIFFIFIIQFDKSHSNEKTAFVDIDYIIQNSNIGKKMLISIEDLNKQNINKLQKKDKFLKDLEIEIKNKKNVISEDVFNEEVISFRKKVQEFQKEKNKLVKDFNGHKKKELENIFKRISPIISDYMDKNSVSILLDSKNVFMGKVNSNLTEEILNKINKELN
jgi:outer membrane protein